MQPRQISPRKALVLSDQRDAGGEPRVDVEAEHRRAEEDQEQLQQQRRALEQLDEAARGARSQRTSLVRASATSRPPIAPPMKAISDSASVHFAAARMNRNSGRAEGAHGSSSAPVGVVAGASGRRARNSVENAIASAQVDGGDDDVDLEAAEGLRLQVARRPTSGRRPRSPNHARAQHQQDELARQRRIDRLQRGLEDDEAEDLVRFRFSARPASIWPFGIASMPARMISVA